MSNCAASISAKGKRSPSGRCRPTGNEDEFSDPFRFDIGRSPNFHIGFGLGTHFCLGANLARLEIRVVFEELLARHADFEIVGDLEWTNNNRLVGLTRLPLRVRARAAS